MTEARRERGGAYAWYVVFVLIIAYTFSYIDRTILTLMVAPIRKTLGISDVQISLLHGLAFAIFYTALGVPIGRLVDRHRRVSIVTAGIITWSVMTALCGFARSFGMMFLARIGVGVGEAALSPAAFSMLSDYFPPHRLGRALSVFTCAMYVGSGIALIAGGAMIAVVPPLDLPVVGHMEAWQVVFLIVGLPGLLVALLVATLREPERSGTMAVVHPTFGEVLGHLGRHWRAYASLIGGLSLSSMVWNGVSAWIPTYFMRQFGWSPSEIGASYGLVLLVCGPAGVVSGSFLADAFRTRGAADSAIRVGIVSSLAMVPLGGVAALSGNATIAMAGVALFVFAASLPYGNAAAAIQEITPNRMRGQLSALYILGINLAGIGLGPTVIALLSRMLGGDANLGKAMAVVVSIGGLLSIVVLANAGRAYRHAVSAKPTEATPAF